jgi:hypothetical protein
VSELVVRHPAPDRDLYLGYRGDDDQTPWARFFDDAMAPLRSEVVDALHTGPVAPPQLGSLEQVAQLLDREDPVETGIAIDADGSVLVSARTPMPGCTPAMWDWWFGWHGSDPRRYKLWHPRAHLSALWGDGDDGGRRGRDRYVGRTSFVDEYLGSTLAPVTIRFVEPAEVGFDQARLDAAGSTAICARTGSSQFPIDLGWLVHLVEPTDGGCCMRSRFWLGGRHTAPRAQVPGLDKVARPAANRKAGFGVDAARDLLVHCSQEMAHLAPFLPELHAAFGDD